MKLKEFIKTFVCPNTLIRLQYKTEDGHEEAPGKWPKMEHQVLKMAIVQEDVIGITNILYKDAYPEAINIVITNTLIGNLDITEINESVKDYHTKSFM